MECGKTVNRMVKAFVNMLMAKVLKGTGSMANLMEMVKRFQQMEQLWKEIGLKESLRAMERKLFLQDQFMKENLTKTTQRKENVISQMVIYTKVNSKTAYLRVKEKKLGLMVANIKANGFKVNQQVKESRLMQMGG